MKMLKLITLLVSLNTIVVHSTKSSNPMVLTNFGVFEGTHKLSFNGRKYAAFEGIPYAEPPTADNRFEPPRMIKKWTGYITATKPRSICIQYIHINHNFKDDRVKGNEDCLYLNVYAPVKTQLLPVLFIIHGGAFQFGSARTGLKYLMDKDIVVVTINYRLGIFGFLSTEDANVPGNMGLKDQSLALRWASENIQHFGGDPKKITLLGVSAGGASVHYHYLSPMSIGLFQNGISMSGTAFGPGKHTENSREKSQKLAALLDCPTKYIPEMVACLRTKPAKSIVRATSHFMPWLYNPFTPFGPVVEKMGSQPFVNRKAIEIINSGDAADVLWITSLVEREGLYPVADFISDDETLDDLDKNWETIAPHLLDFNFTIPLKQHAEVVRKIRQHYFGSKSIDSNSIKEIIDVVGDRLYKVDGDKAARFQAQMNKSPVLFLLYNYRAQRSVSDYYSNTTTNWGVSHSDDYAMLFEDSYFNVTPTDEDREMQTVLIDYIVSVASNGLPHFGPGIEWKKVDPSKKELDFLYIKGPNDIRMASDDNIGDKKFWSTIDFDENKLE